MKRFTSIKTRITIWYTTIMVITIAVIIALVSTLSYRLSLDNIEKDVILQVTQVADKLIKRNSDIFATVENNKEFKNVSIYTKNGDYIVGQYNYDIANLEFKDGILRRETVDGKEYIVYDIIRPAPPGLPGGFNIRGAESVNSTVILSKSALSILLFAIPFIILLATLGGYYITKKAFSPINNIIKTANKISNQNDINARIKINSDSKQDELYNLSVTLNNMLDKIEQLIAQEKQFTSDASHELRTPLSVILAQSEYLTEIADTDKERELANNIVLKTNQVSKLVSRLLLLSRIDQNRQKLNKEKVDLEVLFEIAFDELNDLAESKNINLISDISEDIIVEADESLLLSAITNLISNGIKYGNQDGYVKVTAKKNDDITKITISDNGIGIAPENLNKIWNRFYRVDDVRNDQYESNGLGLSMVKSIIELHGGSISVQSELNVGTEFTILI